MRNEVNPLYIAYDYPEKRCPACGIMFKPKLNPHTRCCVGCRLPLGIGVDALLAERKWRDG